jgi:hypothetical protein
MKMDGISAEAERLFVRLVMKADDYGRFHADGRLVKANCFPLIDAVTPGEIAGWLAELSTRGLIVRYQADGREVLAIVNFGQRLKSSRAKFPAIPGEPVDWLPVSGSSPEVPGSSGKFPLEVEEEAEEEEKGKGTAAVPPAPRTVVVPPFEFSNGSPMAELKSRINSLRPEWGRPAQWNHSEDRLLVNGTAGQMTELEPEDWDLLRSFFAARIDAGEKGYWRPANRSKFVETFPDVFTSARKWARENGREQPKTQTATTGIWR